MSSEESFWRSQCPERGAGLDHTHWTSCRPEGTHPGARPAVQHLYAQCCHCEHTAESWQRQVDLELREAMVDPDSLPLALGQSTGCVGRHESLVQLAPLIGAAGLEWPTCNLCGTMIEPKLATGNPNGPKYGPGRGWVTPRMQLRWKAIAYRFSGVH